MGHPLEHPPKNVTSRPASGATLYFHLLKRGQHFFFRRRIQHIACGKLRRLRIAGSTNPFGSFVEVVISVAKLNVWAQQEPIGTASSERHADAARVEDANVSHHSVERHVSVSADDGWEAE